MVPETSKKFFPQMALGFSDPRVKVHITDGIKFVQESAENTYDAIIVDSSDPVGPAEVLFQKASFLRGGHLKAVVHGSASVSLLYRAVFRSLGG